MFDDTIHTLRRSAAGAAPTSRDGYSRMSPLLFGAKLPEGRVREAVPERLYATPELLETVEGNIRQNFVETIEANPEVEFYLFFPPYSVVHWDVMRAEGKVDEQVDVAKKTAEILVGLENVHVFAFDHLTEIICDLESYMEDGCHYDGKISDKLFRYMAEGSYELYPGDVEEYFEALRSFLRETDFSPMLSK